MTLRRRLAQYGFESNDDYEFALRCLFEAPSAGLKVLNPTGASSRRKTAFASALAQALEFPRQVYFDCSAPPPATSITPTETREASAMDAVAPALEPLERAVLEACAYSEAERCILIIDQLHRAEFSTHLRLYRFAATREWSAGGSTVYAHPRNLLLVLISDEPLYHSLQKLAFKIWTDRRGALGDFQPEDFGLGADAREFMSALAEVFQLAGGAPTHTEYQQLIVDFRDRVRTAEHLRVALYGRCEAIDRDVLYARELDAALEKAAHAINAWVGVEEIAL